MKNRIESANATRLVKSIKGTGYPVLRRNFTYKNTKLRVEINDEGQANREIKKLLDWKQAQRETAFDNASPVTDATMNVSDLGEAFLADIKDKRASNTYIEYEVYVRTRINPSIGKVRLVNLTDEHIRRLYKSIESGSTMYHCHKVLNRILNWGGRDYKITNPISKATLDFVSEEHASFKKARGTKKVISQELMLSYFNKVLASKFEVIFHLQAFHGLRIAEALGVKYEDIDFENNKLSVDRQVQNGVVEDTLKTEHSYRTIPLVKETRELLMNTFPHEGFVLKTGTSTPYSKENFYRDCFNQIREELVTEGVEGAEDLVTHDFRKYFGSVLLTNGVSIMKVSRMMGHASPDITLKIYAKEIAGLDEHEVDMGRVLGIA